MKKRLRVALPVLVVLLAAAAAAVIVKAKPSIERVEREVQPPLVRAVEATRGAATLNVYSNGTIEPATRSTLVAQIGARVARLPELFAEGSFFRRGDLLVQLDASDFELAVTQAESRVASARVQLEREQAESELAVQEWRELGQGEASSLVLREPQMAQARADLDSAKAALELAKLQLGRTRIRAPFDGRLETKLVDVGQFVAPGTPLARIYATDRAEIALKVPQDDFGFLNLTLGRPEGSQPRALLRGTIGKQSMSWPAKVVRTGSRIDSRTRMISVIAEVEDPFALSRTHPAALPMGLYLDAEIEGVTATDVVVLPRAALREDGSVLVVTPDKRIDIREIEVLRKTSEEIVVSEGIEDGELICISPLAAVIEGMEVRLEAGSRQPQAGSVEADRS